MSSFELRGHPTVPSPVTLPENVGDIVKSVDSSGIFENINIMIGRNKENDMRFDKNITGDVDNASFVLISINVANDFWGI